MPLSSSVKTIAVIGFNAERKQAMGGGSSQAKAFYEVTPIEGLRNAGGNKINITYNQGYKIERGATADDLLIMQAAEAASKADVAIVVGGCINGRRTN